MSYNTKQKDLILNLIKKEKKEFTIKDIYVLLKGKVGLTTIYRLVDKLVEEKRLNKTIGKNNTTYYSYLTECDHENHFYLKCIKCKSIIHVDCDCIDELAKHIYNEHSFSLDKNNICINGLCKKCRGE